MDSGLSARQLIPMYIPLVVVVMVMADALLSNSDRPRCVRLASAPIVGAVVVRFPQVLVAVLAVCTSYAAYVSVRDTHTAVFNPEYGWNAKAYNAEHIDIEPMSAKDHLYGLVGDSSPVARAHFDLHLGGGALVYFKEECSREDMERGVFLYVHPTTNLALPGIHKSIGTDILNTLSRVPGSGVRGRGSGERETTASSLAGKHEAREKEDNGGQGKDGPAGAIAQGGNGR